MLVVRPGGERNLRRLRTRPLPSARTDARRDDADQVRYEYGLFSFYNVYGALKCSDCRLEWKSYGPGSSAESAGAPRLGFRQRSLAQIERTDLGRRDLLAGNSLHNNCRFRRS